MAECMYCKENAYKLPNNHCSKATVGIYNYGNKGFISTDVNKGQGIEFEINFCPMCGRKFKKIYNKITIADARKINELYDNGWTYKEVAAEMRLSSTTVQRYVWHPRNKGTRSYK